MESDLVCEICYLEILAEDKSVTCPKCGENFHKLHLKLWLNKKGSCPICKKNIAEKVNEILTDTDISASEFEDYFVEPRIHPFWTSYIDKDQPISLEMTEDGLKVTPNHKSGEWGFAHLQKHLQPGINTINLYFGYKFDKGGFISMEGLNIKEDPLWQIGIENNMAFVDFFHSKIDIERIIAGYSNNGEGGFGIKFESKKGGSQLVETWVTFPDTPYIAENVFPVPTEICRLTFGKWGDRWSKKSKLQIYKYEEYYL